MLEHARAIRQPNAVAGAILAVLVLFLVGNVFRRDLYAHSTALYWVFDALKFVVVPVIALATLVRGCSVHPRDFGIRGVAEHETWLQFIGLTVFLALILNLTYYATWYVAWLVLRPEVVASFYKEINPTGPLRLPTTLYLAVTAGFVEEVFFRGLPLLYLERKFPSALPRKSYVFGTALIFSVVHWGNGPHEVIATFAFGLLAATLYLRLRDLWPLIGAHVVIDTVAFA